MVRAGTSWIVGWALCASVLAQDPTPPVEPAPTPPIEAPITPDPGEQERPTVEPAATPETEVVAVTPTAPTPPPAWDARYRTHEEIGAWASAWIAAGQAEAVALPAARSGRTTPAFQFGAPGDRPLAERPTVFLIGGLDGTSLGGCEGVVRAADELLRARDALPPAVAFVCVPWGSPDGLARTLAGEPCDGRDRLAVDDDGDLAFDEDGPDDVDGDGMILEMLVEDPRGAWTRGADARFLVPATSGDRLRYTRVKEGRDDDGDGRFNEDPAGGVVLDLAFPVGWVGESGGLGGALPLDDDLSRALADLMRARPPLAVLVFQGNHGLLARAGGVDGLPWSDGSGTRADAVAVKLYAESTQRAQSEPIALRRARGAARPGAALDWIHSVVGSLACEVGVWGALDERVDPRGIAANPRADAHGVVAAEASAPNGESAWARWLDDVRGGIGFVDWHLVDLGDGRAALVGGWMPLARANPPRESLDGATQGLGAFVRKLAAGAPVLELRVAESSRDGEVVTVRARVENTGRLPTGLGGSDGARVTIELPSGARLLWGEVDAKLGVLEPGATSREITAVALVPPGGTWKLAARAPWSAPVLREVKP